MFKPKITKVTIELDGESHEFYVRQAGAREMLLLAQASRQHPNRTLVEQQSETFKLLARDESGTPLTKPETDALFEMSYSALRKLNAAINSNSGIQDDVESAAKN